MAWFLFVDESGHDRAASPYEVLAGIAIEGRVVRTVIARLHEAEIRCFGRLVGARRRHSVERKKAMEHRSAPKPPRQILDTPH